MSDCEILSSLANSVRLKLICCLGRGPKSVNQLIASCGLSQSAVSQHLAKLRSGGIVKTKRDGQTIFYSLSKPESTRLARSILSFINK